MKRQSGRRAFWPILAAALALPALPAAANHTTYSTPEGKLGWSACGWAPGHVVTVGVDPAFPFPDPGYADRLAEAVTRWNEVLSTTNRGGGMAISAGGPADIVVQYRPTETSPSDDPAAHDVLGETYLQRQGDADSSPNIGRCPDRQPLRYTMAAATVRMNPRDDWYTGPDSQTEMWQMCDGERFRTANGPLCADSVDFGSTMVHELGHALVLYHPQTLDDIDGVPLDRADSASTAAQCVEATGRFEGQATMCAGQGLWRAEQRTLETWDVESTHRLYS